MTALNSQCHKPLHVQSTCCVIKTIKIVDILIYKILLLKKLRFVLNTIESSYISERDERERKGERDRSSDI